MENILVYKEVLFSIGLVIANLALILCYFRRVARSENEKKAMREMFVSLLSKYSNRDKIIAKYDYDTNLGIYKHKFNGLYYCHKCLTESTKESALKPQKDGLYCSVCGTIYKNP